MKASKISDESKALHKLYRDGEIDEQTLEDSMTSLALLPPPETALDVYSRPCGLDPYLDNVKDKIDEFKANPPPLNTEKGRKQYASMARKVSSFKTALDGMGKDLVDELKDVPKKVDAERKRIRELLDQWRDDVRKPLDDWQAEQDAIEAKRLADIAAKELQDQVDRDHELAIFLYADYLREQEEARKQAIIDAENAAKAQKEREDQIAREAAENARIAAEKAAADERQRLADEQARKDAEAKAAIERAEREKAEAEDARLRQEQASKDAAIKAEQDRLAAIAKAEADKQAAIEAERKRQADAAEAERLAAEQREKNKAHAKRINNEILQDFMVQGLSEDLAKAAITAMAKGLVRHVKINY